MPKLNCFPFIFLLMTTLICTPGFANKSIKTTQRLVVIDPGHGGSQTGIQTSSDLSEKNIVLKLAQKTAEKLDMRYNILLTRTRDTTLLSKQRVSKANTNNADLFISIHLSQPRSTSGFFHYFNPPAGSSDTTLSQNATWKTTALKYKAASKLLAETFLTVFSANKETHTFSIMASPTVLLEGVDMPAILIEPFPISILPKNTAESEAILDDYALLISKSIDLFFQKSGN